ncbi:MAG: hypothetical protein HQL77_14520 [Magnetococcales bacterium]|nr:hypothetical protein [Magnetococcales bacterium]
MSVMFDSLAYVKKLKAAGMPEPQAEVQAETIMEWMEDRLATKVELETIRTDLKRDIKEIDAKIESIRADLKRDIKELDVKTEARFKELDVKTETRFKELDAKTETRFKELDAKTETRFKELDAKTEIRLKELDSKTETTKTEIKRDLKELELRMVIKTGAMILGGIGLLFGLMRAWPLPVQYVSPPATQEKHMLVPPAPAQPPVPLSH